MNESYLVTKSNALINSHYDLSLEEQRIIITLASLVQPTDEDFKPYKFAIKDFMELIGVETKSKYSIIPKITKALMQKVFEIRQDNKIIQVAWLSSAEYSKGTGIVELEFSPKLKPFMLGLKEMYTTYRLKNILEIKRKYSIRMYEILKSNEFKKVVVMELNELKEILKANTETYLIHQNFKSRILEPAQKELKQKTDIKFEYEEIKTGRKITAIKFIISQNNPCDLVENIKLNSLENEASIVMTDLVHEIREKFENKYKGKLMDKFVENMLTKRGIEHVRICLNHYEEYLEGRTIGNIAGDFYTFVMKGYEKPTKYKGKVPKYTDFKQREYTEKEYEQFYANLQFEED
jgi:plasmid replication initiation protein